MIHHLHMGLMWNMPVPVACSLAVAAGGIAVTCGQCPLDSEGRVLAPGDAATQSALVAKMAQGVLSHLPEAHHAALLTVYHDCADPDEILAPLARAFPMAELAPIRLPHFYYPGMRIEVDLYATSTPPRRTVIRNGPALLARIEGGPLTLLHLSAPDTATALPLLASVDPARLLSAQWFAAEAPPAAFAAAAAARVLPPAGGVTAILTLTPGPVTALTTPGGAILRRDDRFAWLSAHGTAPDLAQAAHQAMDALSLPQIPGMTVLKATTHYQGGPGPRDLHGNLAVRHSRFPQPGPASTGVPVTGLAAAALAIDMLAVIDSPSLSAYPPP